MNLEINHWNNTIMDNLSDSNTYISKRRLNESVVDDSNYVSEDSVTLTEGSLEKDEDSLDYQNDDANIDSITRSISEDFHDVNDNEITKTINNMKIPKISSDSDNLIAETLENLMLIDKDEINLVKEIELRNIVIKSDDREVNVLIKKKEKQSNEINDDDDIESLDDANFYDCEDSECNESFEKSEEILPNDLLNNEFKLNVSYDIITEKLENDKENQKNCIELFDTINNTANNNLSKINYSEENNSIEKCSITNDTVNIVTNKTKSQSKFSEMSDASSDESSCLDFNDEDFASSDWLFSLMPVSKDEEFDIENIFSFKKMKLTNCKISEQSSLCYELTRKYSQINNSHLNAYPQYSINDSPIDFTLSNIHSSTPYSIKHKNQKREHNKNETFSKSSSFNCKSSLKSLEIKLETDKPELICPGAKIDLENTFNVEEPKANILLSSYANINGKYTVDIKKLAEQNSMTPYIQIDEKIHDSETIDVTSVKTRESVASFGISKLRKPHVDAEVGDPSVQGKPSRMSRRIGSLLSIVPKVNSQLDKLVDEPKNKSLMKLPMDLSKPQQFSSLKPPSNNSALTLKRLISKTLSRDSVLPDSNSNEVITKPNSLIDFNRRHTLTEDALTDEIVPEAVVNSRPTSLIKSNEMKPPVGNCKIAKPIRPATATISDQIKRLDLSNTKIQKSFPVPSIQKETGIPKNIKAMKLQSGIQTNFKSRQTDNPNQPNNKINNTQPTIVPPILSENPPIISPTSNSINNPLNRTFDREDFQILKSFTNTNNNYNDNSSESSNETVRSSSTDTENNNKSQISKSSEHLGIYQLAMKEEETLKKHVNSALFRQTTGFRSLKLPSQIKPRIIPIFKK